MITQVLEECQGLNESDFFSLKAEEMRFVESQVG